MDRRTIVMKKCIFFRFGNSWASARPLIIKAIVARLFVPSKDFFFSLTKFCYFFDEKWIGFLFSFI